nr:auxin transporter-like protein 2 [Ipomoea batatas]
MFSMKNFLWHGGSAWDAWFSCASNQVAQVLLTLPYSFSQLGISIWILFQIFYGLIGSWTAYLISVLYVEYRSRKEKEGVSFKNHVIQRRWRRAAVQTCDHCDGGGVMFGADAVASWTEIWVPRHGLRSEVPTTWAEIWCATGDGGVRSSVRQETEANAAEKPPFFMPSWTAMYAINIFIVGWVFVVGFGFGGWASVTQFSSDKSDTFGLFAKCYQCKPPKPVAFLPERRPMSPGTTDLNQSRRTTLDRC